MPSPRTHLVRFATITATGFRDGVRRRRTTSRTARKPGVNWRRARQAQPGAARSRALGRGRSRRLPAVHVHRGRRHTDAAPSELAGPRRPRLADGQGRRPTRAGDAHAGGLRFRLRDVEGVDRRAGRLHGARFRTCSERVATSSSTARYATACSSRCQTRSSRSARRSTRRSGRRPCLISGAQRSSRRSCCSCTRSVAGAFAAWKGRRRLAESAQNALIASFAATAVASVDPARRARAPRLLVPVRRRPHEPRAPARLHAHCVLGWTGGLAPALAARALRLLRRGRADGTARRT